MRRGWWEGEKARCPVVQIDRALKQGRTRLRSCCCNQPTDHLPAADYSSEYPRHKRGKASFYSAVHLSHSRDLRRGFLTKASIKARPFRPSVEPENEALNFLFQKPDRKFLLQHFSYSKFLFRGRWDLSDIKDIFWFNHGKPSLLIWMNEIVLSISDYFLDFQLYFIDFPV